MGGVSVILSMLLMLGISAIRPDAAHSQPQRVEKQLREVQQVKERQTHVVQPREVDLMCEVSVTDLAAGMFKYAVRVKNEGVKTFHQVMFTWLPTKNGTMVEQDGG